MEKKKEGRIIKFRGWDAKAKKMYRFDFHTIWNAASRQEMMGTNRDLEDDHPWRLWNVNHPHMQFTALHDKNGKEIYEGDVLKFTDWDKWPVDFQDGSFHLISRLSKVVLNSGKAVEGEVIGNIYENPELLK
jgi:uncharacterized phage protein (TIGR01671 family)